MSWIFTTKYSMLKLIKFCYTARRGDSAIFESLGNVTFLLNTFLARKRKQKKIDGILVFNTTTI